MLTLAQAFIDVDEGEIACRIIDVAKTLKDGETILVSDAWQIEVTRALEGKRSNIKAAVSLLCTQRNV